MGTPKCLACTVKMHQSCQNQCSKFGFLLPFVAFQLIYMSLVGYKSASQNSSATFWLSGQLRVQSRLELSPPHEDSTFNPLHLHLTSSQLFQQLPQLVIDFQIHMLPIPLHLQLQICSKTKSSNFPLLSLSYLLLENDLRILSLIIQRKGSKQLKLSNSNTEDGNGPRPNSVLRMRCSDS
jgi:hypothetical protein